jgi:hypothetical protein
MGVIVAAGAYPLVAWGSPEAVKASVAAAVMATLNVLAGYAAIEYSAGKSMSTFMKFVLGGMGIRLALMAGALIVLTKVFGFHAAALVAALGVFYLAYLTLEVVFIQRKLNVRQGGRV